MNMDACRSEFRRPLRFFFFSYPALGHMIPLIDIAKLFSRRRGVSCTFVTTPATNTQSVLRSRAPPSTSSSSPSLPKQPSGAAWERTRALSQIADGRLLSALPALKDPFHDLLRPRADCVVSDIDSKTMWIDDVALALGIPRILFVIVGVFPATVVETVATLPGAHDESVETLTIEEGIDLPKAELSTFLSNPEIIRAIHEAKRSASGWCSTPSTTLRPPTWTATGRIPAARGGRFA
ncbi:scopoletin glucosyltransferase-like [Iris pallida]|uniref:Scopoletin glucosyltransferase-like n=1 Tax=Iris pallida TaxID=29817 RepID=A0AAX6H8N6_IRIPA|nr:scopoletin glucosyltransferase-like [Iris pallida]